MLGTQKGTIVLTTTHATVILSVLHTIAKHAGIYRRSPASHLDCSMVLKPMKQSAGSLNSKPFASS